MGTLSDEPRNRMPSEAILWYEDDLHDEIEMALARATGHHEACSFTTHATSREILEHFLTRQPVCEEFVHDDEYLDHVIEEGINRMFEYVTYSFPYVRSGDPIDPLVMQRFSQVVSATVRHWLWANTPKGKD